MTARRQTMQGPSQHTAFAIPEDSRSLTITGILQKHVQRLDCGFETIEDDHRSGWRSLRARILAHLLMYWEYICDAPLLVSNVHTATAGESSSCSSFSASRGSSWQDSRGPFDSPQSDLCDGTLFSGIAR
ncbi:MAG: hypothetical protein OXE41_10485, partial [Gammaproteobacteria bacterium]|nr:hypothetical protein [Gammaproteobacteria bacterium]